MKTFIADKTIRVSKATKKKLDALKATPREAYEGVLFRLLREYEEQRR